MKEDLLFYFCLHQRKKVPEQVQRLVKGKQDNGRIIRDANDFLKDNARLYYIIPKNSLLN